MENSLQHAPTFHAQGQRIYLAANTTRQQYAAVFITAPTAAQHAVNNAQRSTHLWSDGPYAAIAIARRCSSTKIARAHNWQRLSTRRTTLFADTLTPVDNSCNRTSGAGISTRIETSPCADRQLWCWDEYADTVHSSSDRQQQPHSALIPNQKVR